MNTKKDQGSDSQDSDANPADGITDTISLTAGEEKVNVDAGKLQPASLSGLVWEDSDLDSVRSGAETNTYGGINVSLVDNNGNPINNPITGQPYTTTTAPDGSYQFDNLFPGTYQVKFELNGYNISPQDSGGNDGVDSDIDTTNFTTGAITLNAGDNSINNDAGVKKIISGSSGKKSTPKAYVCKDSRAINFSNSGIHKQELCKYEKPEPEVKICKAVKPTCPIFTQRMKIGDRDGQPGLVKQATGVSQTISEVALLQTHLQKQGFYSGPIDGIYDQEVFDAVSAWQVKYRKTVLDPWGLKGPTGFFYQSSERNMNIILGCNDSVKLDTGKFLPETDSLPVLKYAQKTTCDLEEMPLRVEAPVEEKKDEAKKLKEQVEDLQDKVNKLINQTDKNNKSTEALVCERAIKSELKFGDISDEVLTIKKYLNEQEGENLTLNSNYDFELITAIKRYQNKYAKEILEPWYTVTQASGKIDKTTRGHLNKMMSKDCRSTAPVCPYFNSYLGWGSRGEEVKKVQRFLAELGFYQGEISGIYDSATVKAVKDFQNENAADVLKPWGIPCRCGTGYWYKSTMAFANELVGCQFERAPLNDKSRPKHLEMCIKENVPWYFGN